MLATLKKPQATGARSLTVVGQKRGERDHHPVAGEVRSEHDAEDHPKEQRKSTLSEQKNGFLLQLLNRTCMRGLD